MSWKGKKKRFNVYKMSFLQKNKTSTEIPQGNQSEEVKTNYENKKSALA